MSNRPDGLSLIAIRAFRYMRDEGGWFRPYEIVEALKIEGGSQRAMTAATKALEALQRRGHAALDPRQLDDPRPRYGITSRCSAPELETLTPSPAHKPTPQLEVSQ